jgi:hypothetical protein
MTSWFVRALRPGIRCAVAAGLLARLVLAAPVQAAPAAAARYAPIFTAILPALKAVQIPIKLPVSFPSDAVGKGGHLYASVQDVSRWSYIVTVDYTRDCAGVDACSYAEIDGGPTLNEPNILDYPWGRPVRLAHNVKALYRPFSCGASCGQSAVVFTDPSTGIVYMVGIYGGSEKDTLALANTTLAS